MSSANIKKIYQILSTSVCSCELHAVKYYMKGRYTMDKNEYNFDNLFFKEEDTLDDIISYFNELEKEEKDIIRVSRPDKVRDILQAYKILKYLTQGTKTKVKLELNEPFASSGCVCVIGRNISFTDSKLFMQAVKLADNLDVYPLTNGNIQMDLGFHNLTKAVNIKEDE